MVDIADQIDTCEVDMRTMIEALLDDDVGAVCDYILKDDRSEAYIKEELLTEKEQCITIVRNRVVQTQKEIDMLKNMVELLLRGQERMIVKLDKLPHRGEI